MYLWEKMGIIASNPCFFTFAIGTFIGVRGVYFVLKKLNQKGPKIEQETKREKKDPNDDYRMIIGVRNDLKMQKGKVAAQCGHAAVAAYAKALLEKPKTLKWWLQNGCTKITVKVESEEELLNLADTAKENDVLASIVRDAGQTQVAPGTRTTIAIGPGPRIQVDKVTKHLKLY